MKTKAKITLECKLDFVMDGVTLFTKGKKYTVVDRVSVGSRKGVFMRGRNGKRVWFWLGSDYFTVSEAFIG